MKKKNEMLAVFIGVSVLAFFILYTNIGQPLSPVVEVVPEANEASAVLTLEQLIEGYSGNLEVFDEVIGDGEVASVGATISVHYTGALEDGEVFDSSLLRGIPFEFTIGAGQVIPGWEQGLAGMRVGGKRVLIIPPELGYGSQTLPGIPSNSILIFEIELLEIK